MIRANRNTPLFRAHAASTHRQETEDNLWTKPMHQVKVCSTLFITGYVITISWLESILYYNICNRLLNSVIICSIGPRIIMDGANFESLLWYSVFFLCWKGFRMSSQDLHGLVSTYSKVGWVVLWNNKWHFSFLKM
jgi:hypothetical protein